DHLLIREDAVKSGTISDFLELQGRPVSLGRRDSSTLSENRTLMSAFGLDIDSDFNLVELGFNESADALADGRIDGMSLSGGVPIGAVQDVFEELGDGLAALEINDEQLAVIDGGRGLWQRVVIPSGTYPGQDRDIFTIGTPNILAVRADVDEDVVYQITRTIFEELEYLHGLHSTTRQISLDNAVNNLPFAIHEGAARYFKEKGVELPLPPVELDPDLLARFPTVEDAREAANLGVVSMFAGTEGDTSTQVAAELASVLDDGENGVRLLATNGGGIGRNLTDLLYLRGVDTALVRADLLNYARDQQVYPTFESQVNYISEMFPEEVHLLVRSDIDDIKDLTGKKVNLGAADTGANVTGSIILSKLGIRAESTFLEPRMAIEKLEQGEIAGTFLVGGKPMPLLRQIDENSGLKLIAIPTIDYFDSYVATEIPGYDYPN
ncbi:MAG: TAXI family TRAP transporter solute-binding subunit, partial [Geminicoccaceae bacterium]